MYPEIMVVPMREELTRLGIEELRSAADVDQTLQGPGTTMVVVNSICGCAAGRMRPAVRLALQNATKPAVVSCSRPDQEATNAPAPISQAIRLLRPRSAPHDGKLVYMMERRQIESRDACHCSRPQGRLSISTARLLPALTNPKSAQRRGVPSPLRTEQIHAFTKKFRPSLTNRPRDCELCLRASVPVNVLQVAVVSDVNRGARVDQIGDQEIRVEVLGRVQR